MLNHRITALALLIPGALLLFGGYISLPQLTPAPLMASLPTASVRTATPWPTITPSPAATATPWPTATPRPTATPSPAQRAAQVLARANVPVLCYHQIRSWTEDDAEVDRPYIVDPADFAAQMDFLDQHGYHPISPEQLYAYLSGAGKLPSRPVLISFDDGDDNQWNNALPILRKHGFTATFFIMTVVLDKPNYMSSAQVRELDRMGMSIGVHTWDHHRVTRYSADDWRLQLAEPTALLEQITGHPMRFFAYPYGLWNRDAVAHIERAGFSAAFQLEEAIDQEVPLFTLRRRIVNGYWSLDTFREALETFGS